MCFFKSRDFVISLEFEKKSWNFFRVEEKQNLQLGSKIAKVNT